MFVYLVEETQQDVWNRSFCYFDNLFLWKNSLDKIFVIFEIADLDIQEYWGCRSFDSILRKNKKQLL